jgi:hypothetical protein
VNVVAVGAAPPIVNGECCGGRGGSANGEYVVNVVVNDTCELGRGYIHFSLNEPVS